MQSEAVLRIASKRDTTTSMTQSGMKILQKGVKREEGGESATIPPSPFRRESGLPLPLYHSGEEPALLDDASSCRVRFCRENCNNITNFVVLGTGPSR